MGVAQRCVRVLLLALWGCILALALGLVGSNAAYADGGSSKLAVSDPATIWDWDNYADEDTSNIGRVWTDKTVFTSDATGDGITIEKGDADFLTSLSALSSSSNLRSMSSAPLDIVLVLDASGSMDYRMSQHDRTKRIDALRTAANAFIDEIAKRNTGLGANLQHQVSVVKFASDKSNKIGNDTDWQGNNYSQVMKAMTACTTSNANDFKSLVNAIRPSGATNAQAGMELAQTQTSGRENAKKVVVFFTDGEPTVSSGWSDSVASGAIAAAKSMKDGGATIYSVSVISGANPSADPTSSRSNADKFMHAISSNYPSATYTRTGGLPLFPQYTWNFGERAKDSSGQNTTYYKSASSASELAEVFDEIGREIVETASYPTKTTEGAEDSSGYITFDDELGAYMEVSDLSKLVYNGTVYTSTGKTTSGNVDTYSFEGEVNTGYAKANLNKLIVTVTRSEDVATGDKVQVKIPASLIPLRHFEVNLSGETSMSITDAKPIELFYSSSVKSAALDLLANPDDAMKAYMAENTDANTGKVQFYANAWNGDTTGDVTATFEPSEGNAHYYFITDRPLYTDADFGTQATSIDASGTYYYKHEYYAKGYDGKPVLVTDPIELSGATAQAYNNNGAIGTDSSGCFIKSGTPRFEFINSLYSEKSENTTETAADALNPQWDPAGSVTATTLVSYLGNNGKVSIGQTATLSGDAFAAGTKTLTGRDMIEGESFGFTLTPDEATAAAIEDGEVTLSDTEATVSGAKAGEATKFNFGTATFTKPGTYNFTVAETSWNGEDLPDDGTKGLTFDRHTATVTVTVSIGANGKLTASAVVANGSFTNAYQTSLSYTGSGSLSVAKTLNGRDMTDGQFSIKISPQDSDTATAQEAADALGISLDGKTVSMTAANDGEQSVVDALAGSDVTFTQANVGKSYTYEVVEEGTAPNGYSYDSAARTVVITVADDPETAALTVTTTVTGGSEGEKTFTYPLAEGSTEVAVVPFVNSYSASTDVEGGTKATVDASKVLAGRDLTDGEFKFGVHLVNSEADVLTASNAADGTVSFGELSYTTESLAELVDNGSATKGQSADGKPSWTVSYVMYEDTTNLPDSVSASTQPIAFTVTVVDNGDGSLAATTNAPADGFVFENTYSADSASVEISGLKKLEYDKSLSPASIEGKFTFTIGSDDDNAPLPEVRTTTNDANNKVKFDKITFTLEDLNNALDGGDAVVTNAMEDVSLADAKAGVERSYTFTYNITESGSVAGVTNDDSVKTVQVKLTDDGVGHLSAKVIGDASQPNFVFTNTYSVEPVDSSVTDQLSATKLLNGRDMIEGEFAFELVQADGKHETVATGTNDANGKVTLDPVTYTKAGTYNYTLREKNAGRVVDGVTYDSTTYSITTTVKDDGQGGLSVEHKFNGDVSEAQFTNEYQEGPTSVSIGVSKVLTGATLEDGQFTFQLTGDDGTELTAANDADGAVSFALSFNEPGTYEYTLSEVNDGQENISYDESSYGVTVVVSEGDDGKLSAEVSYADGSAPVFTNVCDEPEPDPEPTPDSDKGSSKDSGSSAPSLLAATGDNPAGVIVPIVLFIAAGAVVVLAASRMRKRV